MSGVSIFAGIHKGVLLNYFLPSTTHLPWLAFFLPEKNAFASIRHSKNFIIRAFPLLMSRGLSKCEGLTATLAQTLLKLLKVMTR